MMAAAAHTRWPSPSYPPTRQKVKNDKTVAPHSRLQVPWKGALRQILLPQAKFSGQNETLLSRTSTPTSSQTPRRQLTHWNHGVSICWPTTNCKTWQTRLLKTLQCPIHQFAHHHPCGNTWPLHIPWIYPAFLWSGRPQQYQVQLWLY